MSEKDLLRDFQGPSYFRFHLQNALKVSGVSEKTIKHCLAIILSEFPSKIESLIILTSKRF